MENSYYKRYIENTIERKLKTSGAILISGPRFCGKTTTCLRYAESIYRINTKNVQKSTELDPSMALKGDIPHQIDEWQKVPDIWNYVKEDLDIEYIFGKYILTGSSTPADKTDINHSGAGRITPLKMNTMSLFESFDSKGMVSLCGLFKEEYALSPDLNSDFNLNDLAYLICRGGWPLSIKGGRDIALEITKNYYDSLFTFDDVNNESFRNKKPETLRAFIRSYARNISTEASKKTLMRDIMQNEERTMDDKTFNEYSQALKDLYIIEDIDAWCPDIRSKTTIMSTPTRHFVDTSIACQSLNISPNDLLNDIRSFGLFFEDFAIHELRVYAETLAGEIRHYRDNAGLECDAIIHLPDGKWGAIEIKLGGDELIEYGANRLNKLKNKIVSKSEVSAPSFMMILTGIGPLYKRDDGIYVVPINQLKA